jgi:hypothetical protein
MSRIPLHVPSWLVFFMLGPLSIGTISLLAWYILADGVLRGPMRVEYVIPQGASKRIAAGESIDTIPAQALFIVGDELVLNNQDEVNHQVGPFWIPAKSALVIPLDRENSFNYLCTIHPSGAIGLEVRPQNSLLLTLLPTLLLGVPIGISLSVIARVVSGLQD